MGSYFTYIIIIFAILFFGILWLTMELKKISKSLIKGSDKSPDFEISALAVVILICIFILPWLFTQTRFSIQNFSEGTGFIGDTIGGITAPFINGISAILVYIAFKEQIKSNEKQRAQFLKQDNDTKLQSFETFFFIMLEHQYKLIEVLCFKFEATTSGGLITSPKNLLSEFQGKELVREEELKGVACINEFVRLLNSKIESPATTDIIETYNRLFFKHSSYLSHYIRNLFQFIKLIDEKELVANDAILKFLDGEDEKISEIELKPSQSINIETKKYEYIRILRAHFSDAQLEIIALNALTDQGDKFLFYVRKYRLIKNINQSNLPDNLKTFLVTKYPQLNHEE